MRIHMRPQYKQKREDREPKAKKSQEKKKHTS